MEMFRLVTIANTNKCLFENIIFKYYNSPMSVFEHEYNIGSIHRSNKVALWIRHILEISLPSVRLGNINIVKGYICPRIFVMEITKAILFT